MPLCLRRLFGLGLLGFVGLVLWSCLNPFAPELDKGNLAADLITDQSTPDEVLANFKYAYIFRDSLLYANLLDSAFEFRYFDLDQGATEIPISWTREVELKVTGRLLRTFDSINLEFNKIRADTLRDGEGHIANIRLVESFHLNLAGSNFPFSVNGIAEFTFRQSKSDDKWRIVLWVEPRL